MLTFTEAIHLYTLDELSEEARDNAIEEHRRFLLDTMTPADFISGDPEYDTPAQLEEAYNSEYDYYLTEDDPIIESIECNEYMFFEDGDIAPVVTYCNGHPTHPGETWLMNYHGHNYRIA